MNIGIREQKAEAIGRMVLLGISHEIIKQFEENNIVYASEQPFGKFYPINSDDAIHVKQFEKDFGALVYAIVRTATTIGYLDSYGVLIGAFFSAWFLHLTLQPLDLMIHDKKYGVSHYLRQMDNFTIFGSNKRKLRKLLADMNVWLAAVGLKLKGTWQIFRVGFTPMVAKAHEMLSEKKQRHRRPRMPSALGYRFGHGYTILRKHNLFRLKQGLHAYYYRRDRNRVISFKRASGLISRLGQLRKCNNQKILERYYQPKTMFDLKKVVRKESRRLQALYPPYVAA